MGAWVIENDSLVMPQKLTYFIFSSYARSCSMILRHFNSSAMSADTNLFFIEFSGQKNDKDIYNTTSCIEKPYRCPHPKIKFYLYTRRTQEEGEVINVLDSESLWNSHWNPNHPVKIIIHGLEHNMREKVKIESNFCKNI